MNAQGQRVDVLSVMDAAKDRVARPHEAGLHEARAAIAELIEAAQIASNYLTENGCSRERLSAALARVGGAQS